MLQNFLNLRGNTVLQELYLNTFNLKKCKLFFNFRVQARYDLRSLNLKVIVDLYVPFDYLVTSCKPITLLFGLNF